MKTIVVIPARGGSKGIPRKNLRPLSGYPLIYYSINASINCKVVDDVIVTTDDEEIALFAKRFGAHVIMRDPNLANDAATLDPVIADAAMQCATVVGYEPDIVITVQPTSPLIRSSDLLKCHELFLIDGGIDTVISVVDDRHLCWTTENEKVIPAYEERVNRQQLRPNFRETGAIIACRNNVLKKGTRIGDQVSLLEMPQERSFDIDNISDLYLCEGLLNRKKIVLTVVGYPEVGLGHAFRTVMLANELVHHELTFVCEKRSYLAAEYIRKYNYRVVQCENGDHVNAIKELEPHLVINDILDTEALYIEELKKTVPAIVNFEDLGSGIKHVNLVFNALYPNALPYEHVKVGYPYFCLRDEFIHAPKNSMNSEVKNLLITFGGVDEGNLTLRVSKLAAPLCLMHGIKMSIITGPGYLHGDSLAEIKESLPKDKLDIVFSTSRISDYMCETDAAITSGGRTVFELAALKVPTVAICQNERETTHTFASSSNGIINLGFRKKITDQEITSAIETICLDFQVRDAMRIKLQDLDLTQGKKRVCQLIEKLLH